MVKMSHKNRDIWKKWTVIHNLSNYDICISQKFPIILSIFFKWLKNWRRAKIKTKILQQLVKVSEIPEVNDRNTFNKNLMTQKGAVQLKNAELEQMYEKRKKRGMLLNNR